MKKNFKRTLAKVMAVALTVSMVGVTSTDVDAAKKIKLSKKSISVAKGATKKVTIKNVKAKKVKKLTVKSKNKKIATVKKAGKTAFKVTGKKAGKSTKVTVKVKVGKKTTKLTLKVKVTKAKKKKVVVTAAPATTAPSATPAASAPATSATPAASASATPATEAPTATPTVAPKEVPDEAVKAGVWKIDLKNETVATKGKDAYRTDVEYGEDGSVTFTNAAEFNGGMVFGLDADKNAYDLSKAGFKYVRIELTTDQESSLKGFNDASSWWNKFELYEGNTTPDKDRVIYYELSALEDKGLDLEAVDGFGIGFQGGSKGALVTLKSMSLVKEKDAAPVVVETPEVETAAAATKLIEGETTSVEVKVESATVESVAWSVDTDAIEVAADKADQTKATVTAVAAGSALVTAKVTAVREGKTFVIEKSIKIDVAKKGEIIFDAAIKADATEKAVGESASIEVSVNKGDIEKVEWTVDSENATLVSDGATAKVSSTAVGEVTVTAKVSVKGSSIVDTKTITINFIADRKSVV